MSKEAHISENNERKQIKWFILSHYTVTMKEAHDVPLHSFFCKEIVKNVMPQRSK